MSGPPTIAPSRLISSHRLARLEAALFDDVTRAKTKDPLAPVVVMVGSSLLGRSLARSLAARCPALINAHFVTIWRMAEILAGGDAAADFRPRPPEWVEIAAIEQAIESVKLNYFAGAIGFKGFAPALLATVHDLRDAGLDEALAAPAIRAGLKAESAKLGEVANVFAAFKALYQARFRDDGDLLKAAAGRAERFRACFGAQRLQIYGLYDLTRLQSRMIEAIADHVPLDVYLPHAPGGLFAYAGRGLEFFMGLPRMTAVLTEVDGKSGPAAGREVGLGDLTPPKVEIVSAPGEIEEVEEIAGRVVALAEAGLPLARMAVIAPALEIYTPLIREVFDRVGIHYHLVEGPDGRDAPGARTIAALIELIPDDRDAEDDRPRYHRPDLERLIISGDLKFPDADSGHWTADAWRDFALEAGVVEGRGDWDEKLTRFAERARPPDRREAILRCRDFIVALIDRLETFPDRAAISEHAAAFDAMVRAYLNADALWAVEEELVIFVEGMKRLDGMGIRGRRRRFKAATRSWLERDLVKLVAPGRRFQDGAITVGAPMPLRGARFSAVFVPGLQARLFPAPGREDPALLDRERRRIEELLGLDEVLPRKSRRPQEDRLIFALLLQSGLESIVITYPRLDPEARREKTPSPFLIELASVLAGKPLDYSNFGASSEVITYLPPRKLRSPRPSPEILSRRPPLDLAEAALLRSAAQGRLSRPWLTAFQPFLERGLELIRQRAGRASNPFLGRFQRHDSLSWLKREVEDSSFSATTLEAYARCPFLCLCRHVLKLQTITPPEEAELGGMEKGSFVHGLLHRFMEKAIEQKLIPLQDQDRAALLTLLGASFDEQAELFKRTVPVAQIELALFLMSIRRTFDETLDLLVKLEREAEGFSPISLETSFGLTRARGKDLLSRAEPVLIELGAGRSLKVRGRIDRIDLRGAAIKSARVIDYKTGKVKLRRDDDLRCGTAIQPAIYLLAAAELFDLSIDELAASRSGYAHVLGDDAGRTIIREGADYLDRARAAIGEIASGFEAGIFCPLPAEVEMETCGRSCDYRSLCGAGGRRLLDRLTEDDPASRVRQKLDGFK